MARHTTSFGKQTLSTFNISHIVVFRGQQVHRLRCAQKNLGNPSQFSCLELLRVSSIRLGQMFRQSKELGHFCRRTESLWDLRPVLNEAFCRLRRYVSKTWPNFPQLASHLRWISSDPRCFGFRLWFKSHIRSNGHAAIESIHLVAAVATVFLNQLISLKHLWS